MISDNLGASVKEPKMVTLSRKRKIAVAARATARFCTMAGRATSRAPAAATGAARVPKIFANRISFHTPRGTFTAVVERNVIMPVDEALIALPMVSVPLATVKVAA